MQGYRNLSIEEALREIEHRIGPYIGRGKVADYIPVLKKVDPDQFAMAVTTVDGREYKIGNWDTGFSIQSISKAFNLTKALGKRGDQIWKRVRQEPSGRAFNSIIQLESENGIPRNPFINPGAIVIADLLHEIFEHPVEEMLDFIRKLAQNDSICINEEVFQSEKDSGAGNYSSAYLIKSFGNLHSDVHKVLSTYFALCSIEMNTLDLARSFLFLANHGRLLSGEEIVSIQQAKRINAVMLTCGTYDNVGEFAYRVGLPAKSGVGGGIAATYPGEFSIAVWSPGLNEKGNSVAGFKALEDFTTLISKSIF